MGEGEIRISCKGANDVVAGKCWRHHHRTSSGSLGFFRPFENSILRTRDIRHEARLAAAPVVNFFPDSVVAGFQPFGKGRRLLVDKTVIVLDEMHPTACKITGKACEFRCRKSDRLDRRHKQRAFANACPCAKPGDTVARPLAELEDARRGKNIFDPEAGLDRAVAEDGCSKTEGNRR